MSESAQKRDLIMWLWRNYMRQHTGLLVLAFLFLAVEGSMLGALSWMMQPMFDQVFLAGDQSALWWVGFGILGTFVVRALASVVQNVLLTRIAQNIAASLRTTLLDKLMRQDNAFHQTHAPGFLIQRIQADVESVNQVWHALITGGGRDLVALIALLGVTVSVDWRWTLVALVGAPILVLPSLAVQGFVRRRAREVRDIGAKLATRLDEVFHGIVPVKLNRLEDYQSKQYRDLTQVMVQTEIRSAVGASAIPGLIDIMSGVGFLGVLVYGGSEIISGEKTVGQFMAFFTAMGLAFEPLRRLGLISGKWQVAAAGIERIRELLDAVPKLVSPPNPKPAPKGTPEIRLQGVSLSYGSAPVLRGTSFTAEAGKTVALVGPSGAGKSTIFNVLTRLVDPQKGKVTIGGVPVAAMSLEDLRDMFSVVSQDALLFDETLRENILLGRKGVPDSQLKSVLDAAHVSDFLKKLPDGLDTRVGPRGSALSGGQRQRVVITRALLRDTPILLLDEATSALDAQSESVVQEALDRLSEGRTTLVIAHRLSTVRDADKIVVMDKGQVVEQGSHEELLALGGTYAGLHRLQFSDHGPTAEDLARRNLAAASTDNPQSRRRGVIERLMGVFGSK